MNFQDLRKVAHEALDAAIDNASTRNLAPGLFDVQLIHTTVADNDKVKTTVIGATLAELKGGAWVVEDTYVKS